MKSVSKLIASENMIKYLQSMLDDFIDEDMRVEGRDDRIVNKKFDAMIACKEMVEAMIGMPVNLQKDGRVTVGF